MPEAKDAAPPAETGGKKRIRTVYRQDRFEIDKNTVLTGEFVELSASRAKDVIALAKANRVGIVVEDA